MNSKPPVTNQGIALLSALMIVVFITTTISIWIMQTKQYLLREQRISESLQTWQIEQGADLWVINILKNNFVFKTTKPVLLSDNGKAFPLPPGWKISMSLLDAQSLFNINNLQEAPMQISFVLLLQNVLKTLSAAHIKQILNATLAWINPGINQTKTDFFNQIYRQAKPAYQSPGQPMITLSEWKKVNGVSPNIYRVMYPYLIALPETTPLNLNTCNTVLLKTLKPNLTDENIQKIIFARGEEGFTSDAELFGILQELQLPVEKTTVKSQYFLLDLKIISPAGHKTHVRTLFYRPLANQNKNIVSLIQRAEL